MVVPYQVFPVADGHIIIACGNDGQFGKLCAVLGDPEIAQDARFKTNTDRVNNRVALIERLIGLTTKLPRAEILEKLEKVTVPAGPINSVADVFADPHVIARGMALTLPEDKAKGGTVPGVRSPISIGGKPMVAPTPSPRLGQHTEEILREIGEA